MTLTVNEDGSYVLNGTATANTSFYLANIGYSAGTYTLSLNNSDTLPSSCYTQLETSGGTKRVAFSPINSSGTFDVDDVNTLSIVIANGTTCNNFTFYPMLNTGSTAEPFEKYTGGIAAPNPSYPYPVKSVTGDNTINICGKNLFKEWIGATINPDTGVISSTARNLTNPIEVQPSTTYTMWRENTGFAMYSIEFDKNDNWLAKNTITSANTTQTFTTNANTKYVRLYQYTSYAPTNKAQLEKGSVATDYVEHEEQNYQLSLGDIELNSSPDGTIRDAIIGKPNEWYKREYIGKVVLDGSESWEDRPSYQYADRFVLSTVMRDLTQNDMLINNFKYGNANSNTYPYLAKSGGQCVINFSEFGSTTLEQFKEWLTTHNTIVYGTRVTPTDIPITDTTLITQLNNIYNNAHSYNGVTNITTTYEDGNEQMYLDIEALKNVWEVTE
jgi:hypothetical protein